MIEFFRSCSTVVVVVVIYNVVSLGLRPKFKDLVLAYLYLAFLPFILCIQYIILYNPPFVIKRHIFFCIVISLVEVECSILGGYYW